MANRATRRKFSKELAKKTTRKFVCEFMGESTEFELRNVRGADDILTFRREMVDISKKAKDVRSDEEDIDAETGMELMNELNEFFVKMLKAVVVVEASDDMTDEDWRNLALNAGGVNSPLYNVCLECVGLSQLAKSGGDKEHTPF